MQHKVSPFIYTNKESFENYTNYLKHEREVLEGLNQYKIDLKSQIELAKESIIAKLDNIFDQKVEKVRILESQVQENIDDYTQKGEYSRQTESLRYDLTESLEQQVDTLVMQISRQYDIKYESSTPVQIFDPVETGHNWVWSQAYIGTNTQISSDEKTINAKENGWTGVLVDIPMTEGKYAWKIQLDKMNSGGYQLIGVAERNLDLNSNFAQKSFWGFEPNYAYRFVKGLSYSHWGKKARVGDIIEVQLEFFNNKGTLSFLLNGESLGDLCQNLDPPLYPAAQLWYKEGHQMSLVG